MRHVVTYAAMPAILVDLSICDVRTAVNALGSIFSSALLNTRNALHHKKCSTKVIFTTEYTHAEICQMRLHASSSFQSTLVNSNFSHHVLVD